MPTDLVVLNVRFLQSCARCFRSSVVRRNCLRTSASRYFARRSLGSTVNWALGTPRSCLSSPSCLNSLPLPARWSDTRAYEGVFRAGARTAKDALVLPFPVQTETSPVYPMIKRPSFSEGRGIPAGIRSLNPKLYPKP